MPERIQVLVVMARQYRGPLLKKLKDCDFSVLVAGNCKEAERLLGTKPPVSVVLSDFSLADGSWNRVLGSVTQNLPAAQLVVCCRKHPAESWAKILGSGVYDLLVEPYQQEDVRWMVEAAACQS